MGKREERNVQLKNDLVTIVKTTTRFREVNGADKGRYKDARMIARTTAVTTL